ncbi:MAG: hypothetical protein OXI66_01685 [Boseongicola sp.]|nr:hypothetical protein [Rhodospirillaceae bacterium]MDE0344479.1 hypothetical protein [Boseongicola sp.]
MSTENKKPSAQNDDENPSNATNSGEPAAPQTNFDRLIAHLPEDSLTAKLVAAYAAPGEATPTDAVAKVVATRLDELKQSHDDTEDQQD